MALFQRIWWCGEYFLWDCVLSKQFICSRTMFLLDSPALFLAVETSHSHPVFPSVPQYRLPVPHQLIFPLQLLNSVRNRWDGLPPLAHRYSFCVSCFLFHWVLKERSMGDRLTTFICSSSTGSALLYPFLHSLSLFLTSRVVKVLQNSMQSY